MKETIKIPEIRWIDSHCHYECGKFAKNLNDTLKHVNKYCEKLICVGTNKKENAGVIRLSEKNDFIYNMVGYFPTSVDALEETMCKDAKDNMNTLILQLSSKNNVGLGEIGLDYSWNQVGSLKGDKCRDIQKKWFINQINLARELNKPISIHSRDAEQDTVEIIKKYDELSGVVHCFSYSPKTANIFVERGLYLGIGGTSTYRNSNNIREAIKETPIERILLETDAPYLAPEPVRGTLNTSDNIYYVIQLIAKLKGISEEDVIKITNNNCYNLFFK